MTHPARKPGKDLLKDIVNDATTSIAYSAPFYPKKGEGFSAHFAWHEDSATYTALITLWATNIPKDVRGTDVEGAQAGSDDGFWIPVPEVVAPDQPTGGDGKSGVAVNSSEFATYRWKVVRSAGDGTISAYSGDVGASR